MPESNTKTFDKEWYDYLPTEEVKKLQPFLPVPRRPTTVSLRYLLGARRYQSETNCAWRKLPPAFGNTSTIYNRLLDWGEKGVLSKAFEAIALENGDFSRLDIDSTFGKCKRTAMSCRSDGEDRCCGLSKGGSTTKLHMVSDALGRPVSTAIAQGRQNVIKGLRRMYPKLKDVAQICRERAITCYLNADKAYDSAKDRKKLMDLGIHPIILYRDIQTKDGIKKGPTCVEELSAEEWAIYKERRHIENSFCKLKDAEALAFRKCRTAKMYKQVIDSEALFRFWL